MNPILGHTNSSIYSIAFNQGCYIESFTLVNTGGATMKANLAINRSGVDYKIIPRDTAINVYEMYVSDTRRQMAAGDRISLAVTGETDYCFSISK